jgi:hypothetical protein
VYAFPQQEQWIWPQQTLTAKLIAMLGAPKFIIPLNPNNDD